MSGAIPTISVHTSRWHWYCQKQPVTTIKFFRTNSTTSVNDCNSKLVENGASGNATRKCQRRRFSVPESEVKRVDGKRASRLELQEVTHRQVVLRKIKKLEEVDASRASLLKSVAKTCTILQANHKNMLKQDESLQKACRELLDSQLTITKHMKASSLLSAVAVKEQAARIEILKTQLHGHNVKIWDLKRENTDLQEKHAAARTNQNKLENTHNSLQAKHQSLQDQHETALAISRHQKHIPPRFWTAISPYWGNAFMSIQMRRGA